jgi:hypothetical protein
MCAYDPPLTSIPLDIESDASGVLTGFTCVVDPGAKGARRLRVAVVEAP